MDGSHRRWGKGGRAAFQLQGSIWRVRPFNNSDVCGSYLPLPLLQIVSFVLGVSFVLQVIQTGTHATNKNGNMLANAPTLDDIHPHPSARINTCKVYVHTNTCKVYA